MNCPLCKSKAKIIDDQLHPKGECVNTNCPIIFFNYCRVTALG